MPITVAKEVLFQIDLDRSERPKIKQKKSNILYEHLQLIELPNITVQKTQ